MDFMSLFFKFTAVSFTVNVSFRNGCILEQMFKKSMEILFSVFVSVPTRIPQTVYLREKHAKIVHILNSKTKI